MLTLRLERFHHSNRGTIGRIRVGDFWLFTLEEPWNQNRRYESCIPLGFYPIVPHVRPDGRSSILLKDVPHRTEILFHPGNTLRDTEGCILPGMEYEATSEVCRVFSSAEAMDILLRVVREQQPAILYVSLFDPYIR